MRIKWNFLNKEIFFFNEEASETDQFEKMGLLFKGSLTSSNTDKVNIKRSTNAISLLIKGVLRLTQVESEVEGNTERNLCNQSTSPRSILPHFCTDFSNPISLLNYWRQVTASFNACTWCLMGLWTTIHRMSCLKGTLSFLIY